MRSPTSHFPPEIERQIFEIAAEESFSSIPRFCRVAWRVNSWLRPMLYRVLQIQWNKVVPPVYCTSRSEGWGHRGRRYQSQKVGGGQEHSNERRDGRRDSVYGEDVPDDNEDEDSGNDNYNGGDAYDLGVSSDALKLDFDRLSTTGPLIKVIVVQGQSSNTVISVLKRCTSVEDLSLWMIWMKPGDLVPSLSSLPHLKRLSIDPANIFASERAPKYIPKIPTLFDNITHLEVLNCTNDWDKWDELAAMPHLTHLALHPRLGVIDHQMSSQVMLGCIGLKVLILSSYQYRIFHMELDESNDKVVRVRLGSDDALVEWEGVSRGSVDWLWVQAAELMRKRLASRCEGTNNVS